MSTTTRPSRLADLLPHPALRAPARPAPAPTDKAQPDAGAEQCRGHWSGPDVAHAQHAPCTNLADWAGLSEHDHAKTTLRCTAHRSEIDAAISEGQMFCLTCHRNILTMTWQELS